MAGQIYTGGGGRIVGPENDALALRDAINDLELQVAFVDGIRAAVSLGREAAESAMIYTRAAMWHVGIDHPVLVMPASVREQWLNDPATPEHLRREYTGQLPARRGGRMSSFGIVRPGARRG